LLARRATLLFAATVVTAALAIAGYFGVLQLTGNFHAVVEGALYRSGQPSAADIARYHQHYGIRTIVNLRGESDGADWYRAEVVEAEGLGISVVNFRMSSGRQLTWAQAAALVSILQKAEKPILVHCKAGADRSGLASALYVAAIARQGEAAAERQISIRYGHVSIRFLRAYAMDRSFEALEPWLGYAGS